MKPLVLLILLLAGRTGGGLTAAELASVQAAPVAGATAPLSVGFVNEQGRRLTLGQAMDGRPTVLVFADYTCVYLCGPGLVLTAAALDRTRLRPGRDYSFVVVGFDPRDGPAQALAMRRRRLSADGAGAAAQMLSEGRADIVARALGYRYVYDASHRQYAHDTSIYILAPDGRVSRLLPQFDLTPATLTSAIRHAADPHAGPLQAPLRFLCYCLSPLTGAYDQPATLALRVGGVGFLLALGAGFAVMRRRRGRGERPR